MSDDTSRPAENAAIDPSRPERSRDVASDPMGLKAATDLTHDLSAMERLLGLLDLERIEIDVRDELALA